MHEEEKIETHEQIKQKRTRISRRAVLDFKGKKYDCDFCEKSYLSGAALYQHRRTKHIGMFTPDKKQKVAEIKEEEKQEEQDEQEVV